MARRGTGKPRKDDGRQGGAVKPRWDLLPVGAVREIVRALTHGAAKYGDSNWVGVLGAEDGPARYYAALMRHVTSWWEGEEIDPESGLSHLAHAGANLVFLMSAKTRTKK